MPKFELVGAQRQLQALARDLKDAGEKDMRRALYKNLNAAAKPLLEDVKREAAATLPKSGGAADRVAGAKYGSRVLAGPNPGVKLRGVEVGSAKVNLRKIDRGILRHPLFGDRNHWYNTNVTPGFWTRPLQAGAAKARVAVEKSIAEMALLFYAKRP